MRCLFAGIYLSAERRKEIRFSHSDYWFLNWEIRQAIAEGGGHGFKERIRDEETKINIEIRYVVAQDVRMGDIDYHCNRTQYKSMRDVCARFLRVPHSI